MGNKDVKREMRLKSDGWKPFRATAITLCVTFCTACFALAACLWQQREKSRKRVTEPFEIAGPCTITVSIEGEATTSPFLTAPDGVRYSLPATGSASLQTDQAGLWHVTYGRTERAMLHIKSEPTGAVNVKGVSLVIDEGAGSAVLYFTPIYYGSTETVICSATMENRTLGKHFAAGKGTFRVNMEGTLPLDLSKMTQGEGWQLKLSIHPENDSTPAATCRYTLPERIGWDG